MTHEQPSKPTTGARVLKWIGLEPADWSAGDRRLALLAFGIVLAITITAICGYVFAWEWTGLVKPTKQRTFWDSLSLLIVPLVLALGGYFFSRSESRRARKELIIVVAAILLAIDLVVGGAWLWEVLYDFIDPKKPTEKKDLVQVFAFIVAGVVGSLSAVAAVGNFIISRRTLEQQRQLEEQSGQGDALQTYLDTMLDLLIDKRLRDKIHPRDDTRVTARARTLTLLSQLDGEHKKIVLQFLWELRLISREEVIVGGFSTPPRTVGLGDADLSNAQLQGTKWVSRDRHEHVSLEGAILEGANLQGADLEGADLRETDLNGANLSKANLQGAEVAPEQLNATSSLEGATMPNGQKYEDWLKDREDHKENGDNE